MIMRLYCPTPTVDGEQETYAVVGIVHAGSCADPIGKAIKTVVNVNVKIIANVAILVLFKIILFFLFVLTETICYNKIFNICPQLLKKSK
jgi:hypothetical protein